MANHPDALQSSRRSQCFSASVRTTWLYRLDAIQCLTSVRVSASRHIYGKTAATVEMMSSIRQERAYQVQPSGRQPSRSGRSKPYYGNFVQPKCNRPDARATPSGRGLVMEAFSATLERRLQLTVRTLGQAVRTPSGILVITFYSNIGLGQNQRRWKAKKKLYKFNIWMAYVRTEIFASTDGPAENSIITFWTRKTWPVQTALAPVRTRVPQNPFLTRFWLSKAYI
jgi:hypothetical protein